MERIIRLFLAYRSFVLFVVLETVAFLIIIQTNEYQNAVVTASSNTLFGGVMEFSGQVNDFVRLRTINRELVEENAQLRAQLTKEAVDTVSSPIPKGDRYKFIPAKVIKNTRTYRENHLTINVGRKDSIINGMGIINGSGVVGIVEASTQSYSIARSLLNESMHVSSALKKDNQLCLTHWEHGDYTSAKLLHLGRHVEVFAGDTVVTSGGSSVFPPGIMVGTVKSVKKLESEAFLRVIINLSVDFGKLSYVYVVENQNKVEIDSLDLIIGQ